MRCNYCHLPNLFRQYVTISATMTGRVAKYRQNSSLSLLMYNFGFILIFPNNNGRYRVSGVMTTNNITDGLTTQVFGSKFFMFESIDSTNNCARLLAECGVEEGTVVYAEEQSSGRGRLKRKWFSNKGENLLFSIIFAPEIKERRYYLLPLLVSVCVVASIKRESPDCPVVVKWPNDILLTSGHKIGGLLTELTRTYDNQLRIVVGVGINVNQTEFPKDIASAASSLQIAMGRSFDRTRLLHLILTEIESHYDEIRTDPDSVVSLWKSHCNMFDKPIRVEQGRSVKTGICKDIDKEGAILLEDKKGRIFRIIAGDVTSVAVNSK